MLNRLFTRGSSRARLNPQARALLKISDLNVGSANCTLVRSADGQPQNEELGRVLFFKTRGRLMVEGRGLFVTTPDGIKAENRDHFRGKGEILSLWFLHERVPRVVECRVEERVRFPADRLQELDPKVGIAYRLAPLSDVVKQDKRSSLRFSHRPGSGGLPVYPQVLFDTFVSRTDLSYPTEGAVPPQIEDLRLIPPGADNSSDQAFLRPEDLVQAFKQSMVANPPDGRTVHVSKPYLEERHNRTILIELGFSDVLGLNSDEVGRTLHIKKPLICRTKDRRDPHYLTLGHTLVLHYGSRSSLDGSYEYYELVTEVSKGGLENITIRPLLGIRREEGLRISLMDFSVNGARFENSPEFMRYTLGKGYKQISLDAQLEILQNQVLLFSFYPRLRFSSETESYRPSLPKRICILGQIVRGEVEWQGEEEEEEREGRLKTFGIKFMYDPVEYSRDIRFYDRWEMIRPFKENRHFKEVHKSLNGLVAFLESQLRE